MTPPTPEELRQGWREVPGGVEGLPRPSVLAGASPEPAFTPPPPITSLIAVKGEDFDLAERLATYAGSTEAAAVVLLVAMLRRVDTFMVEVVGTLQSATSGGLLGLLSGRRG